MRRRTGRAKPRKRRGNNYYCEVDPKYRLPEGITLKITLLAIIARYSYAYYEDLLPEFEKFAPHPNAYNMLTSYIRNLIGDIKKLDRGKVKITRKGLKKLLYFDKKYGLLPILKDPIQFRLKSLEEEVSA